MRFVAAQERNRRFGAAIFGIFWTLGGVGPGLVNRDCHVGEKNEGRPVAWAAFVLLQFVIGFYFVPLIWSSTL